MAQTPPINLSHTDLSDIRDAVPTLDLFAIRSLRRAGFQIVRQDMNDRPDQDPQPHETRSDPRPAWGSASRSNPAA
jgi:hypothetical protein